jgi:Trk K+ transport system NAD-binding subunit
VQSETVLTDDSIILVAGTSEQVAYFDTVFVIYGGTDAPVVIVGGGQVGLAVARALKAREVVVHVVEREAAVEAAIAEEVDRVIIGDAADPSVLLEAGLATASSVVLTCHDDSTNLYLAVLCRTLNPDLRIISRIMRAHNLAPIMRAGADFALSSGSLGVRSIISLLQDMRLVVIGEVGAGEDDAGSVGLFRAPVPASLAGKTLADSGIGARTGLSVVAVMHGDETITNPSAATELAEGGQLIMLGTTAQQQDFVRWFRG